MASSESLLSQPQTNGKTCGLPLAIPGDDLSRDSMDIEPIQDSMDIEPIQDSMDIEPIQDSMDIEPIQDSVDIEPIQDSVDIEPAQDNGLATDQNYGETFEETTNYDCNNTAEFNLEKSRLALNPFLTDDSSHENETRLDDGQGCKKCAQETESNIDRIRSAQQALIGCLKSQNSNETPSGSGINGHPNGLEGSVQERAPVSLIDVSDGEGGNENIAAFMRYDSTDNSWMEQDDGGVNDAEEFERLNELEADLKKRKAMKNLSETDSYQLTRVTNELKLLKRRMEIADRNYKEFDDVMFVPETILKEDDGEGTNDQEQGGTVEHSSSAEQPVLEPIIKDAVRGTKRRRIARNAQEVEERRREKECGKSQKRKNKLAPIGSSLNRLSTTASKTPKWKQKKTGRKPREYRSRMKGGRSHGGSDALESMLGSLRYCDPIKERLAQEDFGLAPEIHERSSKKRQMDALMASIPNDYDTHKTSAQKSDLLRASRSFGYGKVVASDGKWKLKGMKSSLYHHQLLAAEWMVKRELGVEGPHGGLLADAMGLGKTLEVLAAMVGNPPIERGTKRSVKGTLLVLPNSAIKQWGTEIRLHAEQKTFEKVLEYRARSDIPLWALQDADIVLTSYSEVRASFPYPNKNEMKDYLKHGGHRQWYKVCQKDPGLLHQVEWYRIVLDEAHAIKNLQSWTSLACQQLKGRYRWVVSGTPVQNRLEELFPYFRFLRAKWASNYATFREHFCDPKAEDSRARMTVILSIVMRRTMKDRILSRPIVELPNTHPSMRFVSFSKEEAVIYRTLEARFRECLNRHFYQGTAHKSYSIFIVLLLRLRQCTAHPFLLESTAREVLTAEDIVNLQAELKELSLDDTPFCEQIGQWIPQGKEGQNGDSEQNKHVEESAPFGRSDFGRYFRMGECFDTLQTKDREKVLCEICGDVMVDPRIIDCNHVFCEGCLMGHMHMEASQKDDPDVATCPKCKTVFSETKPYEELNLNTDYHRSLDPRQSKDSKVKKKNSKIDPFPSGSTWLSIYEKDKNKCLVPSAKTTAFKAQVLNWLSDAPNDKILVFTQFRMMAKIIGLIAEAEKWGFVYYTSNMSYKQRHEAVVRFHTDPTITLMIAGLKCGGQALNLTCANRVISMDLWWNHSVEQQAFGRVFRIGQHKETHVTRIIVKNSVDQRLLDLQSEKVGAIDFALQDSGNVVEPLSIEELASLFGHLREGEDGKLRVEEDYGSDEEDSTH